MPKALQRHLESHTQDEGDENGDGTNAAAKSKKQKSNGKLFFHLASLMLGYCCCLFTYCCLLLMCYLLIGVAILFEQITDYTSNM